MRFLISGSRSWINKERVFKVITDVWENRIIYIDTWYETHNKMYPNYKLDWWPILNSDDYSKLEILEGAGPTGVDHFARDYARDNELTFINVPARWNALGLKAGPIRNIRMLLEYKPDIVICFHNDIRNSKGTKHMLEYATGKLPVLLVTDTTKEWVQ